MTRNVTSPLPADLVEDEGRSKTTEGRRKRGLSDPLRLKVWGLQLIGVAILFGAWQLCASTHWLNPAFTSSPSEFIPAFVRGISSNTTPPLLLTTLYETLIGFGLASALGIVVGMIAAEWRVIDLAMRPFMTAFNNVPRVALAPLFVLWFGLGPLSRVVLIVSLGFFVVAFNTYAGLQTGGRDYLLLARTLGAGRLVKFRKFVFPSALPAIFAGLQLCLTYAFLGAVVGEMLSGSQGLGGYLALQIGTFDTSSFFGALFLLVIVSGLVSAVLRWIEGRLLRWRQIELGGVAKVGS